MHFFFSVFTRESQEHTSRNPLCPLAPGKASGRKSTCNSAIHSPFHVQPATPSQCIREQGRHEGGSWKRWFCPMHRLLPGQQVSMPTNHAGDRRCMSHHLEAHCEGVISLTDNNSKQQGPHDKVRSCHQH